MSRPRLSARVRGREGRHRADRLELHVLERCPEDLAERFPLEAPGEERYEPSWRHVAGESEAP